MYIRHYTDSRGIVLLSVIIILLSVALIGVTLVSFFSFVNLSARTIANEAKALYLAESGIAHAIKLLHRQGGEGGELQRRIGPVTLGDGAYTVEVDYVQSLITSVGTVDDVKKTVQLQYNNL